MKWMPRYVYRCVRCGEEMEVVHGMSEREDKCKWCLEEGSLIRIPSFASRGVGEVEETGMEVKRHIEGTREEIKKMKEDMKRGYEG